MKLRNKKTGETVYVDFQIPLCNNNEVLGAYSVTSLKELNERFEDYTPQEPQEEIGKQLISSPYDKECYWADEKQQEAFREFCRKEDSRPEYQEIPTDVYSDNTQCLSKDFGGVLSGNDRPRNMSEFIAWRSGEDFLEVREENERLGRERWKHFVETNGLEKFSQNQEPLTKDKKISYSQFRKLIKETMREAEAERIMKIAKFYAELYGEED